MSLARASAPAVLGVCLERTLPSQLPAGLPVSIGMFCFRQPLPLAKW